MLTQLLTRLAIAPAAALAAAALAAPAAASTPCPGANVRPTSANMAQVQRTTLCLLNHERRLHGLRPVRLNSELSRAARAYSRRMVHGGFFSHTSPGGSTLLRRVSHTDYPLHGYHWLLGENLAWGAGRRGTPGSIMRAWMDSPGHRHNILTARFTDVGVGIVLGAPVPWMVGGPSATYTTDFGTP